MSIVHKHLIIFPRIQSLELITVGSLEFFSYPHHIDRISPTDNQFISKIVQLTNRVFNISPGAFLISQFDSMGLSFEVLERHYAHLLLMRFQILSDGFFQRYEDTEFLFLQLNSETLVERDNLTCFVNGLEPLPVFINDIEPLNHNFQSSMFPNGYSIKQQFANYDVLSEIEQFTVLKAIQRYVLSHAPLRHSDEFSRIISLVSGIEGFLSMQKGEGADVFGTKLASKFKLDELFHWGKEVYTLRSHFAHLHGNVRPASDLRTDNDKFLYYKSIDESIRHTGHFVIAKTVLKALILHGLVRGTPSSQEVKEILYCNELPFKRIVELIDQNIPMGDKYYELFEKIKQNSFGASQENMKRVLKFVLKSLRLKFTDEPIITDTSPDFKDAITFSNTVGKIHHRLSEMLWEKPIELNELEDQQFLFNSEKIIWKLLLNLGTEIAIAARTGHK